MKDLSNSSPWVIINGFLYTFWLIIADIWTIKSNWSWNLCIQLSEAHNLLPYSPVKYYMRVLIDQLLSFSPDGHKGRRSECMVTMYCYYVSCLENRKMLIVTACQLLSHYTLIMDYSLILLLSMWILNKQPWRYWRKYSEISALNVTDFILLRVLYICFKIVSNFYI